ncbi:MAG: hypothetical protein PVJ67_04410 [Candidatus Pacearchaeota archaeon]|jgi:hypothetical protein
MKTKTLKICNKCLCATCGDNDCKSMQCSICNSVPIRECKYYKKWDEEIWTKTKKNY